MAKRDPKVTAKNAWVKDLRAELDALLPVVLEETGIESLASLNAIIGSKHDKYFDLKNEVFTSPDGFLAQWFKGLERLAADGHPGSVAIQGYLAKSPAFRRYLSVFLKRSFLNHYNEWSRVRPTVEQASMWIGQEKASYGLLVTPRFANGQWENDKSEIRAVPFDYWTIGHVLEAGLVVPGRSDGHFSFPSAEAYLTFFENVLVRISGSKYELELAGYYRDFVLASPDPRGVPLMIPEFRYAGLARQHKYRLDFTIINPYDQSKVGFELSPWSTHGYLAKTKEMTQAEINDAARSNFEKEMEKHRDFFKSHEVVVMIYTDTNLSDCRKLFDDDMMPYLTPRRPEPAFPIEIARKYGV